MSSYSFDVTEQDFADQVVAASHRQPVLVDFWASWCGPCQSLMPVLDQLADAYQGQFLLAKVEIDQQPNLASQFGVRSVPTVKLFKNGQVVDEFMGALPEGQIREFLDRHIDKESDRLMQQALQRYQQGDTDAALEEMGNILAADPANLNNRLIYATLLMQQQRHDEVRQVLAELPADALDRPEVRSLQAQLEFLDIVDQAPDIVSLEQAVAKDPANSEARYQLAAHHVLQGEYEKAMQQLLEIIKRDRNYGDDLARKTLLKLFDLLGEDDELVVKYRRQMAMALH